MLNGRLISMLIGLGMLGACGEADDRRREAQNDNGADVSMRVEGENGAAANIAIDLPDIKGKITLPKVRIATGDVDIDGVKLYPGSRVTGVDIAGEEGTSEGSLGIRFDAGDGPDKVRDYYLAAFRKKGITASAQGGRIIGRTGDGKPFSIALEAQGEGTKGVLRIGNKTG